MDKTSRKILKKLKQNPDSTLFTAMIHMLISKCLIRNFSDAYATLIL